MQPSEDRISVADLRDEACAIRGERVELHIVAMAHGMYGVLMGDALRSVSRVAVSAEVVHETVQTMARLLLSASQPAAASLPADGLSGDGWWNRVEETERRRLRRWWKWRLIQSPGYSDRAVDVAIASLDPEKFEELRRRAAGNLSPAGF